jgi:methyl-accepting chemotaxis protein
MADLKDKVDRNKEVATELKVEIEGIKRDIKNVNNLTSRIDNAIEKLTDVSTDIKQMLAVHQEKISRQEQIDEIIFDKLKERAGEIDNIHRELTKEIQHVEKRLLVEIKQVRLDLTSRVGMLEKYRWIIMGGAIVVGWFIALNGHEILEMLQ